MKDHVLSCDQNGIECRCGWSEWDKDNQLSPTQHILLAFAGQCISRTDPTDPAYGWWMQTAANAQRAAEDIDR